jgi:hypothetical protein
MGTAADPRTLMDRFPQPERSTVANLFYTAVRAGLRDPVVVHSRVLHTLRHDIEYQEQWIHSDGSLNPAWARERIQQRQRWEALLYDYDDDAIAFAQYVIEREQKPRAEREAEKAAHTEEYRRAYMAQQPPTEKQVAYLRRLGHHGPVGSKAEASALIDRLLQQDAG